MIPCFLSNNTTEVMMIIWSRDINKKTQEVFFLMTHALATKCKGE